jgi:hypothetical protein
LAEAGVEALGCRVVATAIGERFIDADRLAALTGDRVRTGVPDAG